MTLTPGTRLGAYEIVAQIGAGGMGEVYRARDTKLNRDVAIKVLPELFAVDPERMGRFEREAQAVAALSHPNILAIHDFGRDGATSYAVMELLEGETLRERVAAGPQPVRRATELAVQIARGLAAAHERGIVHRDLKPENLFVTRDGRVKILDFGLARQSGVMEPSDLTMPVTDPGTVLGTVGYMSPEQVRGRQVDSRSDIFAFGCVLYELLTGSRAFARESAAETMSAIAREEPPSPVSVLGPIPLSLERIVARCLEKDPGARFQSCHDLAFALESASIDSGSHLTSGAAAPLRSRTRRYVPWAVAAAAIMLAGLTALRPAAPAASFELAISAPPGARFKIGSNSGNVIISPDGARMAFVAASEGSPVLWVRSLDRDDPRGLPGTEGASYPFWAPDSRSIGFFARGKLRTVDVAGGVPQVVADAPSGRGGSWGADGTILFTPVGGGTIVRVPAAGGTVTPVTTPDVARGENAHYWPYHLPGGSSFLYFVRSTQPENNGIYLGSVDGSRPPALLVSSLSSAIYAPPASAGRGHLLWVRNDDLVAQPFDARAGTLHGTPKVVASGVRVEDSQRLTFASASSTGTMIWAELRAATSVLVWMDRDGRRGTPLSLEPGRFVQLSLAPGDGRLLFTRPVEGTADIWTYDVASEIARRVTTHPDYDEIGVWSPDGRSVAYRGTLEGEQAIIRAALDGSSPLVALVKGAVDPSQWAPSGHILFSTIGEGTGVDVWAVPATGQGEAQRVTSDAGAESAAVSSPDGRWIAFQSDRTGRDEIYVAALANDGGRLRLGSAPTPVSTSGGTRPVWRGDGRELFFGSPDNTVYAAPITVTGAGLTAGRPAALFKTNGQLPDDWTPTADGKRFIVVDFPYAASQVIHVLVNWHARLQ
jgi:eukaryotic-like serine/threonine-protein kinase